MGLDINLFRKEKGGDPEAVRESERRRFRKPEELKVVDEIVELDEQWRKSKLSSPLPEGPAGQGVQQTQQGHRAEDEGQGGRLD